MIIAFQTLIYFRESLLSVLDWLIPIWPYYKKWTLAKNGVPTEESDEEQVFADYDEEKGVVFFPPVYAQRYAAVADCLMDERWAGKIEKVVDFGYNDASFIKYLKDVPGVQCILGVDIESLPLRCSSDLLGGDEYAPKKESSLQITLYQGNAADPDYRLIGCDAVVAIEMIEHMLPHDLEKFVHTVFGFIKPQLAVFTTPNGDFNVLFKALEKNGLRRLDHFFEWSREQFHDWCSNIVARYPDYTVTCKGVGPGPAGTHRLGCCSQLALFVCKDYHKQPDLDLNCLALVANAPKQNDLDEMTDSWDSPDPITETNMLCAPENSESYPELLFSEKQSYMTIVFDSHGQPLDNIEYRDKVSQCNIEAERGRNFLMFDEEILCYNVLIPQRRFITKEYEFEDVASRLNCSNFQVKKFSKTTQNLMARNKLDSLVHTREIVDEIRHMTKMLNFDKNALNKSSIEGGNVWNNINWGDNAPYWNQYYKIVKEFNYPFETKSDEVRILDLISEEINRLVDTHDNQFVSDTNKLEIPFDHLMQVVKHITDDVEKVKDLLDWNGYEIVDNVLIYSRLVVDNTSVGSLDDDWQEHDALSDWDTTDGQSMSDASTMNPDVYDLKILSILNDISLTVGRSLRRALDLKVKKLRSLTADEDITTELDRVVCRLLKLALHTSKGHQTTPTASWMQRKLLDLLTLTEKAIERRRKYYIENYPLKSIQYDNHEDMRCKMKSNDTVERILNKYLTLTSDQGHENFAFKSEDHYNEDNMSVTSNEMEPFVLEPNSTYGEVRLESMKSESKEEIRLQITQAWVDGDYDVSSPAGYNINSNVNSSTSNDSNASQYNIGKSGKKLILDVGQHDVGDKNVDSKTKLNIKQAKKNKIKVRSSKKKLMKKVSKKRSSSGQLARSYSKKMERFEYQSYTLNKSKRNLKDHKNLQATLSKPIPRSLIELCYQDLAAEKSENFLDFSIRRQNNTITDNVAATKESFLIDILSEDKEETIALRRTIATEVERNSDVMEAEDLFETVVNVTKEDSFDGGHVVPVSTIDSDTIFLYDLNEPSTSKGIRHVSANVQCGTDILAVCPTRTVVSSLVKISNICETGIKIEDSFTKLNNSIDFGTLTDENNFYYDFVSAFNKKPLKIRDSDNNYTINVDCSMMTEADNPAVELEHIEAVASVINKRNLTIRSSQKLSLTKYVRPRLSCCGIYVHSYRDRQISEDIVFHGEWQRNGPKVVVKKSPQIITRKRDTTIKKKKQESKENVSRLRQENKINKVVEKKSVFKQNIRYTGTKRELVTKEGIIKSRIENTLTKNVRQNVTKVSSKIITSVTTSKSVKNLCSAAVKNNNVGKYKNTNRNNYFERSNKDNKLICDDNKRKLNFNSSKANKTENSIDILKKMLPILKPKTENSKDIFLEFKSEAPKEKTYLVFRNEIENTRSNNPSSVNSNLVTKVSSSKNNCSPPSQNSSPCSSPSSIATVRPFPTRLKANCNLKNSMSPEKSKIESTSTAEIESYKNKKCIKMSKSSKLMSSSIALYHNKENLPETSKDSSSYIHKKVVDKCSKSMISDNNRKVFMLQMRPDSPPSIIRKKSEGIVHTVNSSSTKLLTSENSRNSQKELNFSPIKQSSTNNKCRSPFAGKDNARRKSDEKYAIPEINNLTRSSTPVLQVTSGGNNNEHDNYIENNSRNIIKQSNSKINAAMKQLIDERLNFINNVQDNNDSDTDTIILSRDNPEESPNDNSSPISYKTVITNDNTCNISGSDIKNALFNSSFESYVESGLPSIDTDICSFGSTESLSKFPPYIYPQNDMNCALVPQKSLEEKTVRDIFERKDQHVLQTTGGVLAVQVFSGISMDGEPVAGDQPEYILVDPETGNLSIENARQVTSEEIFVSGRSSDTYESCYVEDEAYVPNWLFHVISQQQSAEIPEEEHSFPEAHGAVHQDEDEQYDANGNIVEAGFGLNVGAGDGRGMHSDQSQDSSGRGTSISSSDVSSGPQSEAILIDPSAFLGPTTINVANIAAASEVPAESSDASFRTVETTETDNDPRYTRGNIQRRSHRVPGASDVDADISSLETDAADSDN